MWMKTYKWMIILSFPAVLLSLGGPIVMAKYQSGLTHGGEALMIPFFIAYYLLFIFQVIVGILNYTKVVTGINVKLVIITLLFQIYHQFLLIFTYENRQHALVDILIVIDVAFFIVVATKAFKFFSSKSKGSDSLLSHKVMKKESKGSDSID